MPGLVGVTLIETSVAEVTVRELLPDKLPKVAVTLAEPVAIGVAVPLVPSALLIVATPVFDELQVTSAVRS